MALQYEFHNVLELIKTGHPEAQRKVGPARHAGPPRIIAYAAFHPNLPSVSACWARPAECCPMQRVFTPALSLACTPHILCLVSRTPESALLWQVGPGVRAIQVRRHPEQESDCFFLMRTDGSMEDCSAAKCVDALFPAHGRERAALQVRVPSPNPTTPVLHGGLLRRTPVHGRARTAARCAFPPPTTLTTCFPWRAAPPPSASTPCSRPTAGSARPYRWAFPPLVANRNVLLNTTCMLDRVALLPAHGRSAAPPRRASLFFWSSRTVLFTATCRAAQG